MSEVFVRPIPMPVKILKNNIQNPRFSAAVQNAVLRAIGDRDGTWEIEIHHFTKDESYKILIVGPLPFGVWQRTFRKRDGATLGQIRREIEGAMPAG